MKNYKKYFYTSFIITLLIIAVLVAILITDYRCRKTLTGDESLPVSFYFTDENLYLKIYSLGINTTVNINFMEDFFRFVSNILN